MSKKEKDNTDSIIQEIKNYRKQEIENLKDSIREANELALLIDGHDNALAGWSTDGKAIYFIDDIIANLMHRDKMTYDEAIEFFDFNIAGSYLGDNTPIYMYDNR